MDTKHTPGPRRDAMLALRGAGFAVREVWLDGHYYDGLSAVKRVGEHCIQVYSGNADDGEYGDLHYAPQVYVDDRHIAQAETPEKAARIADIRASMLRAAIAKATGAEPERTLQNVDCQAGPGDCRFPHCRCPVKGAAT